MGVCCSAGYCSELWGCDCYRCCDDICGCQSCCYDQDRYGRGGHGYGHGYGQGHHVGPAPAYGYGRAYPRFWGGKRSSVVKRCSNHNGTDLMDELVSPELSTSDSTCSSWTYPLSCSSTPSDRSHPSRNPSTTSIFTLRYVSPTRIGHHLPTWYARQRSTPTTPTWFRILCTRTPRGLRATTDLRPSFQTI